MSAEVVPIERPRPLSTLLASAQRLTTATIRNQRKAVGPVTHSWQSEAWDMYDLVGEEHFLATTLAGRTAQAKLFIGVLDEHGEVTESDDPEITDLLRAVAKTTAGRAQLLLRLVINLFVAGEGWLVGIPRWLLEEDLEAPAVPDLVEDYDWRMMSVSEVSTNAGSEMVTLELNDSEGERLEAKPDDLYLIRVWRPHPRRWWEADSPTRACLPVLRELVGLTMHISAQVDSRLAGAGLLIVPQSAQRALQRAAGLEEDSEEDQFTEALMEAMLVPIRDRGSASALVPLVVTVPDEVTDKFQFITFAKPLDTESRNLRDDSLRRLALGQDAPPELLLGTASMNHWGGWLVKEETVSSHIEPTLALICDALTTQYIWPVLREQGSLTEDQIERYVVWYDVSHLIVRPNHAVDALTLHERRAISDASLRQATGFEETDAPETASLDLATTMALEMVQANPALIVAPGVDVLVTGLRRLLSNDIRIEEPTVPAAAPAPPPAAPPPAAPPAAEGPPQTDGAPAAPTPP